MNTKRIYYHGTSADNLESILKYGISPNENKLWNCSNDEVYLWDDEKCNEEWEQEESGFKMANESGQLACCAASDCRVVVIKIMLDESEIIADTSCENMEGRGAVCIDRAIKPEEIIEIQISNDLSLLKGYFMAIMAENQYCGLEFSRMEQAIIKAFKNAEIYPEDIDDLIEWETVEISALALALPVY